MSDNQEEHDDETLETGKKNTSLKNKVASVFSFARSWFIVGLIVIILVGARQIHPGGVKGLVTDTYTRLTIEAEVAERIPRMREYLATLGLGAMCLNNNKKDPTLLTAMKHFAKRHDTMMNNIIVDVKNAGGMTQEQKDLINRTALYEAQDILESSVNMRTTREGLAERLNQGEFDLFER